MKNIIIFIIKLYHKYISRLYGNTCRFYPSCSSYTIESIQKYGIIKGLIKSIVRIMKCNPFNSGGYDPVR